MLLNNLNGRNSSDGAKGSSSVGSGSNDMINVSSSGNVANNKILNSSSGTTEQGIKNNTNINVQNTSQNIANTVYKPVNSNSTNSTTSSQVVK